MTHVSKHIQIPTGQGPDGKTEFMVIGFLTEEAFNRDHVRRRSWVHASILNPVLFQQVRPFIGKGSYLMLEHVDLRRRYKGPDMPPDDGGEGESDGTQPVPTSEGPGPTNVAEAVEKLRALMPGIPDAVADVRQANVFGQAIAEVIALLGGGEVGGG